MKKKKIAKKSSLFTQTAQHIVIQWIICVKTYLRSSQVFTGLHGKVSYFRFSQLKSENGKGVMRREGMWRGKSPLHANNILLISEICYVCEEWRPNLKICEKKIQVNTPTLHILFISSIKTIGYIHEEVPQHFMTLHKDFMLTRVNIYQD